MKHSTKTMTNTSKKPALYMLAIRVNEDEYKICRQIAAEEQRSISQVGRLLIQEALKQKQASNG